MKTLFKNKYFQLAPEILMLSFILFYWLSSSFLNPIAIILTALVIFLIVTKNQLTGIILGAIILFANLYLILAFLSDLNKIKGDFTTKIYEFMAYATLFICVGISISIWLIIKYIKTNKHRNFTIQKN